ncbi:MAG: flagellar motor switch protein FliM [Acidobacteriaceae bacterium]
MEKVLNQEEIDAMVRAARGRATPAPAAAGTAKPWNLAEGGHIGREPLRTITQLHESFARSLTHSLGAYLRVVFEVNLVSVEQLGYGEMLGQFPELTYLATAQVNPANATAALQLDLALAFPIIDLLLGGTGAPEPHLRDITDIEEQILEGVVRLVCKELEAVWEPVGLTCSFEQRRQPGQMLQLMPPTEKTLALSFEIHMSDSRGMLNIVCPSAVSNILLRKLAHKWDYRKTRDLSECSAELVSHLLDCPFDAELTLPPQAVDAQRLIELSAGDSLRLSQSIHEPVLLAIAGQPCFESDVVRQGAQRSGHVRSRCETAQRQNA